MRKRDEEGGSDDERKKQELYNGGLGSQGGGSGSAVLGPPGAAGAGGGRGGAPPGRDLFERLVAAAQNGHGGEGEEGGAAEGPPSDEEMNTITIYSNGFTLNDGPLRETANPENQAFLDELLKGYVPRELRASRKDPSKPMNISLADKRPETFVPPAYVAFSSGTSLGGGAGLAVGADGLFDPAVLPMGLELDDGAPSTTIQIKTRLGKKLRLKVNTSITVLQLAAVVAEQTPGDGDEPFSLSAGFPPAALTDGDATIEGAGLRGASITQK